MKTIEEIEALVVERIGGAFRGYPVVVQESPEDSTTLWVQVFGVGRDEVRTVNDAILGLQEEVLAVSDVILLPMVKNLTVTRECYPEYAPVAPASVLAAIERALEKWEPATWVSSSGILVATTGIAPDLFDADLLGDWTFDATVTFPRSGDETVAEPDEELALAA